MRVLFRIAAFVLLAVILPAAMHCDLLASDILSHVSGHGQACNCDDGIRCSNDGCHEVENTLMRHEEDGLLPVPSLHDQCLCLLCLQLSLSCDAVTDCDWTQADAPSDWVPTWCFERRSAAPPRAP